MNLKDTILKLAAYDSGGYPITSFYLDIDRRTHSPVQFAEIAHQLVRQVKTDPMGEKLDPEMRLSVEGDLDRFTKFVGTELDLPSARGLAAFSCTKTGLWEVCALPVSVKTEVKVGRHARLLPLVQFQDDLAPFVIVLADREKARLFVVELGGIRELEPVVDDVDGRIRPSSRYGLADKRIERHVDDQIRHHLKRVVTMLGTVVEWQELSRVVLAGTPDVVPQLKQLLPPSISKLVCGVAQNLMIISGSDEVLEEGLRVISASERKKELDVVEQIQTVSAPHDRGTIGMASTLQAIYARSVHLLAVDASLSVGGSSCRSCERLWVGRTVCPVCGEAGDWLDDLIEESVRQALCQGADIEVVSEPRSRARLNGMGALLHFPIAAPRVPDESGVKAAAEPLPVK